MTLEELKALYGEKGATQRREEQTEGGIQYYDEPVQLGEGWTAWEKQPTEIIDYIGQGMDATPIYKQLAPEEKLGGFSKQEGDYVTTYDLTGKPIARHKWNESDLKTLWNDLGPMAMAALTMGGGAGLLGNALFGLEGAAAAGAGGALGGGFNAAMNDQNILKGALLGAASGAGSAKLGDILGADTVGKTFENATVGDVTKAINFAQNPTLAGAANLASKYVPSNFDIGDTGLTTSDIIKGVNTAKALGSGDERSIFNAILDVAKGTNIGGLTAGEQADLAANREAKRLNAIENAVLNQPASDDGSTSGILDLINQMYPAAEVRGMSEADLAKFLEANMDEIQGSADLETLLKGEGKPTSDEGTVTVTGNREGDFDYTPPTTTTTKGVVTKPDNPDELVITDKRDEPYVPSIRTKEIKSDIPDAITADQIDKLFPDLNPEDILQLVTSGGTKTTTPTKTTTKTPSTTTTEQALINLGLNAPMPSQDPYANIKLMEELFGGDTAYKLRALGAPKNLASADLDALARLLRG